MSLIKFNKKLKAIEIPVDMEYRSDDLLRRIIISHMKKMPYEYYCTISHFHEMIFKTKKDYEMACIICHSFTLNLNYRIL